MDHPEGILSDAKRLTDLIKQHQKQIQDCSQQRRQRLKELKAVGWPVRRIADRMGMSPSWAGRIIAAGGAPEDVSIHSGPNDEPSVGDPADEHRIESPPAGSYSAYIANAIQQLANATLTLAEAIRDAGKVR